MLRVFACLDATALKTLCTEAVDFVVMSSGDILFETGVEAAGVYYSVQGELRYTQEPAVSHEDTSVSEDVIVGSAGDSLSPSLQPDRRDPAGLADANAGGEPP